MKNTFLSKKISILTLTIVLLFSVISTVMVTLYWEDKQDQNENTSKYYSQTKPFDIRDTDSYKYTKPFIYSEYTGKAKKLDPINNKVTQIINDLATSNNLSSASIYIRDLIDGSWTGINDNEGYEPGSLIKVPMLIYYLKKAELDSTLLNKSLMLTDAMLKGVPNQTFNDENIKPNTPYTIKQLLIQMAAKSDNFATLLLNMNCNENEFKEMYKDLDLQAPDLHNINYTVTAKDYSVFMRILYNGTYLTPKYSDYALSILAQSSFDDGLTKLIPKNVVIAHKFGEVRDKNQSQLHESGIIYCNSRPYLVTIMTKGSTAQQLATDISQISVSIFKYFCT